jgi:hypothetical protein
VADWCHRSKSGCKRIVEQAHRSKARAGGCAQCGPLPLSKTSRHRHNSLLDAVPRRFLCVTAELLKYDPHVLVDSDVAALQRGGFFYAQFLFKTTERQSRHRSGRGAVRSIPPFYEYRERALGIRIGHDFGGGTDGYCGSTHSASKVDP